ncbi:MAG: ATP-binding protein, partial [Clostridia bacterium]|nr:ATP-binding protein [Clostridia bacterium]
VRSSLEGARMLKEKVSNTALHELLYRGYSNIRDMVSDYIENTRAFEIMGDMLPANKKKEVLDDIKRIYAALGIIAKCLKETSASHTAAFRMALRDASNTLDNTTNSSSYKKKSLGYKGWSYIRLAVQKMIRDEINRVDQRAIISVEIINKVAHKSFGYIYGQVKNLGNEVAENITLQFIYSNGFESNIYELSKLGKGDTAAFEIKYSAESGTTNLEYEVMVSYESKGEKYNDGVAERLAIEEKDFEGYPVGLYLTDSPIRIGDFTLLEDGTVHSDNFYGREEEKKRINTVFAGKKFANYNNVIIKGIRRVGKTSMLNYMLKYAEFKCDDAIAVYIDCSGKKGGNAPIQRTLIDSVITECRMMNIGGLPEEEWDAFKQKWQLPKGQEDCNAEDLQYFYRELKKLNADKGLVLIIDEFDILIEAVEMNQGVDTSLLPSLRVLINNPYCSEAIHLVVCGSTKLIRYMDGGTLNQFFQHFGDNTIEIGMLSLKDMEKMLTDPYKDYSNVEITPMAIDWIWKITNGLVWYAKLIASSAIKRAYAHQRSCVYPSDVVDALTTVISNDEYFRSLKESCRPDEIKVLDVMQSLTTNAAEYVSVAQLLEVLSDEFSQRNVESIVNTLVKMQILQRNPFDRYSYRFAVELYWHYFRVSESNYKRREEVPIIFREVKVNTSNPFNDDYFDI